MTVATASSHSQPPVRPPRRHPIRSFSVPASSVALDGSTASSPVNPGDDASISANGSQSPRPDSSPTSPPPAAVTPHPASPSSESSSSTPFSFRSRLASRPIDAIASRARLAEQAPTTIGSRANGRDGIEYATGLQLFGPAPTSGTAGHPSEEEAGDVSGAIGAPSKGGWRATAEQDLAIVLSPEQLFADETATTSASGPAGLPPRSETVSFTLRTSPVKMLGSRLRQVLHRQSDSGTAKNGSADLAVPPDQSTSPGISHSATEYTNGSASPPSIPCQTTSPVYSPIESPTGSSRRSPTHAPLQSPTSPPKLRDDTPIPSPPVAALEDPSYTRPRPFRTLSWSFLPSRSARVVSNRQPLVDREMTDEEKQWVEMTAKVPDDGLTRDRWDNPIGTTGDWGRTVLSPIVTENEASSTSATRSQVRTTFSSSRRYLHSQIASQSTSASGHVPLAVSRSDDTSSPPILGIWSGGSVVPEISTGSPRNAQASSDTATAFAADPGASEAAEKSPRSRAASLTGVGQMSSQTRPSRSDRQPTTSSGSPGLRDTDSRPSTRQAPSTGSSVTKLDNRSPWLDDLSVVPLSSLDGEHRISTPPTSPASAERSGMPPVVVTQSGEHEVDRRPVEHDYHSLSTIVTSRGGRRLAPKSLSSSNSVGRLGNDADFDDYLLYSPPRPSAPKSTIIKSAPSSDVHTGSAAKTDTISRWARAVAPTSTADEPPDLRKNGFRRTSSRPSSKSVAAPVVDRRFSSPDRRPTLLQPSLHPKSSTVSEAHEGRVVISPPFSSLFSPPTSSPPTSPAAPMTPDGEPSSLTTAQANRGLASHGEPNGPTSAQTGHDTSSRSSKASRPRHEASAQLLPSAYVGSIIPDDAPPRLHTSSSEYPVPTTVMSERVEKDAISTRPPSAARIKTSTATRPRPPSDRLGPFPVPQLSPEERAARKALRKAGLSPEHHLPLHETKSERRRQAWLARQAFETERDRLVQHLSAGRSVEDSVQVVGESDIPTLNELAALHLASSVPASRDGALDYLRLSLQLDEAQPAQANALGCLLESRDPAEAIHWYRIANRYDPDNPEYLLDLGNALRTVGDIDSAARHFGELISRFRNTPYEAFAWYKLARMYEEAGTEDDQEEAKESFASAYEALQRLSRIPTHERVGNRWLDLAGLEGSTVYGLGLYYGEEYHALPRLFAVTGEVVQPAAVQPTVSPSPFEQLNTASSSTGRRRSAASPDSGANHDPRILDFAAASIAELPTIPQLEPTETGSRPSSGSQPRTKTPTGSDRDAEEQQLWISNSHATRAAPLARSKGRRKVDPELAETLDVVVKGLRTMSRSRTSADLASSTQRLANHVDATFQRMAAVRSAEAARHDELFRALDRVHRELATLPDRITASEKLRSARPPGIEPVSPAIDPVEAALRRVEQARRLAT